MPKDTPWNTNNRFSPDHSLLNNASLAKKLVEEHSLDDSNMKRGFQELVDAVGEQASALAEVIRATAEGERQKAEDKRELNEVEQDDRRSLIDAVDD